MEKIVVRRKPPEGAKKTEATATTEISAKPHEKPQVRKKLYVHIGMYKTGTTSIQYFLTANTQTLYDLGILYPSTGRHPRAHVQHALIAEAFFPETILGGDFALDNPVDGPLIIKALLHEISLSNISNVVISSESLCVLPPEGVEKFGEAFKDFDIVPIVYIRNFCDLADASYQTKIMHNASTRSFQELGFLEWGSSMDLVTMCRNWAGIAHNKKIIVQCYDDPDHKNSVKSFAKHVGIDLRRTDNSQIETSFNHSVSATHVIIRRDLINAGIDLKHVEGLLFQLSKLPIEEKQTMVPPSARKELTEAYVKQLKALAESDFVTGLNVKPEMLNADGKTDKVFIPNLAQAVFALGRALANKT